MSNNLLAKHLSYSIGALNSVHSNGDRRKRPRTDNQKPFLDFSSNGKARKVDDNLNEVCSKSYIGKLMYLLILTCRVYNSINC